MIRTPSAENLPDGARIAGPVRNRIQVSGEGVTLSGYDFSGFFLTVHAPGFTLRNSFCRDGTGGGPLIDLYPEADGWRLEGVQTWGAVDGSVTVVQQRASAALATTGTIEDCRFMRPRVDTLKTTGGVTVRRTVFDAPINENREHADRVTFLSRRGDTVFEDCDFYRSSVGGYDNNALRIHPNNATVAGCETRAEWSGDIHARDCRFHGDPSMMSFPVHARFRGGPITFTDCTIAPNVVGKYFHHERDGAEIVCIRCFDMWTGEPVESPKQ